MARKVRCFNRPCKIGDHDVTVQGIIEQERFVITAGLIRLDVPTLHDGMDEHGTFAVVEDGSWSLPDGTVLTVESAYDSEPLPDGSHLSPGLEISRTKPPSPKTLGDVEVRAVMETGLIPGSFNPLVPNTWGFSVYFDSQGNYDGTASTA